MMLRRSTARSMTRIAQVVSVVSLALLAAAIILPQRTIELPKPVDTHTQVASQPTDQTTDTPAVPLSDWTVLATSLSEVREPLQSAASNATETTEETTTAQVTDPEGNPNEPRPNPAPPGWQYVGYAKTSDGGVSALVTINAKQTFVRPGMTLENFTVAEVTTERLLLERDDRRFEVKRVDPLPFDATMSAMNARTRSESARGRNARLEQQRMQQIEEARQRRLDEARDAGEIPDEGGNFNR